MAAASGLILHAKHTSGMEGREHSPPVRGLVAWPQRQRAGGELGRLFGVLALMCLLAGCRSTDSSWRVPDWRAPVPEFKWPSLTKKKDEVDRPQNSVVGPLERVLMRNRKPAVPETEEDRLHAAQVKQGREFFDNKQYTEAADILKKIVKERDPKRFRWSKLFSLEDDDERYAYDPIRAEAAFYMAESLYMQQDLRGARNYYKVVVKEYPSTPEVDAASRRLFDIARQWLGEKGFATTSEVQQVNLEDPKRTSPPASDQAPHRFWHLNVTNRSRPIIDTNGHAIDALRTIWTYDSTGPLADDAIMLAATHYLREGDNVEADRLFTLLREQFPKTPHLQAAFVLGSHVKLASYQGSAYEEEQLEDARLLKESTLRLFPDLPESDRIRRELKGIYEARAQRLYERALFWERKGKTKAVAIGCRQVIQEFPDTKYAQLARAKLAELGEPISSEEAGSSPARTVKPFRSQTEDEGPLDLTNETPPASGNKNPPGRIKL